MSAADVEYIVILLLSIVATAGWCYGIIERFRWEGKLTAKQAELDAVKKVGKWYEKRVSELEQETSVLAAQVLSAGVAPIRTAMPLPDADEYAEYAFDETGLIREKLDPRDLPIS